MNIIVDTPKGSRNKYKYDEEARCFTLSRVLPAGAVFPHDFGSIPQTLAEDGDALDVLVVVHAPSFPGCLLQGRLIGTLRAVQQERKKTIRNDRLIAVPVTSVNRAEFRRVSELPRSWLDEIQHFFVSYNRAHGREYRPEGWAGPPAAEKAVREAEARYRQHQAP